VAQLDAVDGIDLDADHDKVGFDLVGKFAPDEQVLVGSGSGDPEVIDFAIEDAGEDVAVAVLVGAIVAGGIGIAEHEDPRTAGLFLFEFIIGAKSEGVGDDEIAAHFVGNTGSQIGNEKVSHTLVIADQHPVRGLG